MHCRAAREEGSPSYAAGLWAKELPACLESGQTHRSSPPLAYPEPIQPVSVYMLKSRVLYTANAFGRLNTLIVVATTCVGPEQWLSRSRMKVQHPHRTPIQLGDKVLRTSTPDHSPQQPGPKLDASLLVQLRTSPRLKTHAGGPLRRSLKTPHSPPVTHKSATFTGSSGTRRQSFGHSLRLSPFTQLRFPLHTSHQLTTFLPHDQLTSD